jgi:arginyl-tRNA synthetase
MKSAIAKFLDDALSRLPELADAAGELAAESTIERTRDAAHGHFASNIAMRIAKPARRSPRDVAAAIVEQLPDTDQVEKVEIAGPGFINFYLSPAAFHAEIQTILDKGEDYGRHAPKGSPRILLEFVSANPTGPLHVGHGRHASYGATVGNLLESVGYPVHRDRPVSCRRLPG